VNGQPNLQLAHLRQTSFDVNTPSDENLGPLPPGWEMARTSEGQMYFMNHISRTTQWEDPRRQIRAHLQQQPQVNGGGVVSAAGSTSTPSLAAMGPPAGAQPPSAVAQQRSHSADSLGPLPQGWEQGTTADGEVYYINHRTRSTTWHDPRLSLQKPPSLGVVGQTADQRRQQDMRLARLENERRALQQRQAELQRQLRSSSSQESVQVQASMVQAQEMLMRQSLAEGAVGADPFLGGNPSAAAPASAADLHNRQESADSGVGMGSTLQLGSIPEDVDMDTGEMDATLTEATPTGGAGDMDVSRPPAEMTADGLISSLGDALPDNIMQDVLSPAANAAAANGNLKGSGNGNLTWL